MESEKQKEDKLVTIERQFSGMQSQIMAFADMKEQTHFDNMAKTLYDSHILGKEAAATAITEAPSPTSKPTSMTTATSAEAAVTDSDSEEEDQQQHINSNNNKNKRSAYKNNS